MKFHRSLLAVAALLGALALCAPLATAQVPSLPNSPYNVPAQNVSPALTPLSNTMLTLTAHGAGAVDTNLVQNIAYAGVLCTFNQSAHTGTPSSTLEVDAYDAASASYQRYVVSGAITADATPTSVMVYPGAALTSTPTGMVLEALKLPRYFRVRLTVAGTSPVVTGTVGCDLLK